MSVNLKKGDRLPVLRATLLGTDGAPLDLTTANSVTFKMRKRGSDVVKVSAPATVTDAAAGKVQYAWGANDTDTAGQFDGEFIVSIGGLPMTVPSSGFAQITIEPGL